MNDNVEKYYDDKGKASHYDSERINLIHQSEAIWGTRILMLHFEIVIFEYKHRLGKKDSDSLEQQMLKIKWYERAIKYLDSKLGTKKEVAGLGPLPLKLPEEI